MKKIFDIVTQRNVLFLIISIIFALPFISFAPFVKTVDNVDYFTLKNDPDVEFYDKFKEVFGNDEFFIIAFEKDDIFTTENLTLLQKITDELEDIDDIREVKSLANVDDTIGSADTFEVREFLEDIPENKHELEKIKTQAINNPLYRKSLISTDAQTAAIVVQPYYRPDDENYRDRLITKTKSIIERYSRQIDKYYLAGWTITHLTMAQYMKRDVQVFVPITYILITLIIQLFYRNIRLTLLAIANISMCMLSTIGLFGLTGITLNNVTTIVPSLVMALALCDTVHIFSHMEKRVLQKFPDRRKALAHVLKKVALPCFLTTITTAVGFLSLSVNEILPIREFAWMASAGMVFEFVFSFFFLPPLILFFTPEKLYREHHPNKGMNNFLGRINHMVQRHYKAIVVLSCLIVLAACWFASKVRVETNIIEYFKTNSPVQSSLHFVEERLSGIGSLDISLKAEDEDAFKDPSNLKVIERIQQHIKMLNGVDITISLVDFIKDMNESFHNEDTQYYKIPESANLISQYLLIYDSDEIEDFVNNTYDHARISVRISENGTAGQKRLIRKLQNFLGIIDHKGLNIRITGRTIKDVRIMDSLVQGQIYSLSLAVCTISIIMFLALRSLSIGSLSLIPNLFPIILNFGVMGAAGIPLNTATALISAVALGIVVDDTIHFLSEYKTRKSQNMSRSKSVETALFLKGRAITTSSVILCIGFGVLAISSFIPTINFGTLCAIIMLTAVVGDIIVLPSVILLKKGN